MTIRDLIEMLQKLDPDLPVWYQIYSDTRALDLEDIRIQTLGLQREDDEFAVPVLRYPSLKYFKEFKALVFPGN